MANILKEREVNFVRLHKKAARRVICILIGIVMLIGSIGIDASAKSVSELQNEISKLEQEAQKIEKDLKNLKNDKKAKEKYKSQLEKSIANYESQIATCEKYLATYNQQIANINVDIDKTNKELDEAVKIFKKRLRYMYMTSASTGDMSILVGSDDFATHLSMTEFSKTVSAYDKKIMEDVKGLLVDLDGHKTSVNTLIEQQNAVRKSLANKKATLDSQVKELKSIIRSINAETGTLSAQLKQVQADMEAYENEVQRIIAEASGTTVVFTGKFLWPVNGFYYVSSPYGYRTHPITGEKQKLHKGIDIAGSGIGGKPVLAAADGEVMRAEINGSLTSGYGRYVVINHGKSDGVLYTTHYAHLKSYIVSKGQKVKKGQVIGYVGSTGSSTGNHLHFEIRKDGTAVNPMNYFSNVK